MTITMSNTAGELDRFTGTPEQCREHVADNWLTMLRSGDTIRVVDWLTMLRSGDTIRVVDMSEAEEDEAS